MEQLSAEDLVNVELPEKLPSNSGMKVWVRSTGYEVRFTERFSTRRSIFHITLFLLLVAIAGVAMYRWSSTSLVAAYGVLLLPVGYLFMFQSLFRRISGINVRLDITPMTLSIAHLRDDTRLDNLEPVPIKQIESFVLHPSRGLGMGGDISGFKFRSWIGSGLSIPDLRYLAVLIVQATKLTMQNPHPKSDEMI